MPISYTEKIIQFITAGNYDAAAKEKKKATYFCDLRNEILQASPVSKYPSLLRAHWLAVNKVLHADDSTVEIRDIEYAIESSLDANELPYDGSYQSVRDIFDELMKDSIKSRALTLELKEDVNNLVYFVVHFTHCTLRGDIREFEATTENYLGYLEHKFGDDIDWVFYNKHFKSMRIKAYDRYEATIEAQKNEIENLMAAVSHNFKSCINNIIYYSDNNMPIDTCKTQALIMKHVIDILGFYIQDEKKLASALKLDCKGKGSVKNTLEDIFTWVFTYVFDPAALSVVFPHFLGTYLKQKSLAREISEDTYSEFFDCLIELQTALRVSFSSSDYSGKKLIADSNVVAFDFVYTVNYAYERFGLKHTLLGMIVHELMMNAIKYSPSLSTVRLEIAEEQNFVRIMCKNQIAPRNIVEGIASQGKGLAFIKTIVEHRLYGAVDIPEGQNPNDDTFKVCINLPISLFE